MLADDIRVADLRIVFLESAVHGPQRKVIGRLPLGSQAISMQVAIIQVALDAGNLSSRSVLDVPIAIKGHACEAHPELPAAGQI